jgi:hypothetical protein
MLLVFGMQGQQGKVVVRGSGFLYNRVPFKLNLNTLKVGRWRIVSLPALLHCYPY